MNIKKIIQEEINDFDWAKDIPTELSFEDLIMGNRYHVNGNAEGLVLDHDVRIIEDDTHDDEDLVILVFDEQIDGGPTHTANY